MKTDVYFARCLLCRAGNPKARAACEWNEGVLARFVRDEELLAQRITLGWRDNCFDVGEKGRGWWSEGMNVGDKR